MSKIPYQRGSDTSKAAGESIVEHLSFLENSVLQAIKDSGDHGMNCWEIESVTGISRQCSSARLNALVNKCLIVDSGIRRKTETGRNAAVYTLRKLKVIQYELFKNTLGHYGDT